MPKLAAALSAPPTRPLPAVRAYMISSCCFFHQLHNFGTPQHPLRERAVQSERRSPKKKRRRALRPPALF